MDLYRHGGDSLQGRYHFHRLHLLSFAEIGATTQSDLNDLLVLGGFPEPFLSGSEKEAKHYHLDWTVVSDPGARLENLVTCHLLKWCHFMEDSEGRAMELRHYRDTTGREVDFVILEDGLPIQFIECKTSQGRRHRGLSHLKRKYPEIHAIQIDTQTTTDTISREGITFRVSPSTRSDTDTCYPRRFLADPHRKIACQKTRACCTFQLNQTSRKADDKALDKLREVWNSDFPLNFSVSTPRG